MALSRIKTWIAEILTYADLNAEFDNVLTNGAGSLSSPRTSDFDVAGFKIIFDADDDTYLIATSDDVIDFYSQNAIAVRFDFSVATPVNGFEVVNAATGNSPAIKTRGADTNIGLLVQPKGTGKVTIDGGLNHVDAGGTADAITATYAPAVTALDDGLSLSFKATAANATTTPTFAPNGLTAKTIVKNNGAALAVGDIAGSSHVCHVQYSSASDKWHLMNPGTSPIDLNNLTTDTTGGILSDLIPFVDVSEANASNKVTVELLMANSISDGTDLTSPGSNQSLYQFLTRKSDGANLRRVTLNQIGAGKQTVWVPAAAMTARTTNGAATGASESTTNKIMNKVLDFDTTTQEFAQFTIAFPKGWDESTVTFIPYWTAASGSGGVVWALEGVAVSDDDVIDAAFGTAQTSTDTLIATTDVHVGPESSAITIAGTPAVGDIVYFQVKRDVSNGSDTLAADARLLGIKLIYTIDSNVDD